MIETGLDMAKEQAPGVCGDIAPGVYGDMVKGLRKLTTIRAQDVINHLTRNQRKLVRRTVGRADLLPAEKVMKIVYPMGTDRGWELFHQRTGGRFNG